MADGWHLVQLMLREDWSHTAELLPHASKHLFVARTCSAKAAVGFDNSDMQEPSGRGWRTISLLKDAYKKQICNTFSSFLIRWRTILLLALSCSFGFCVGLLLSRRKRRGKVSL